MRLIALMLAAAAATLNWSAPAPAAPRSAEQRLGHITIRSTGRGSPVVLIPGLASPPAVFDEVAGRIGEGHQLIFVQVNGFAGSPPPTSVDNMLPAAVDELAGWLAANHIEKPAIIGHSMGGLLAMMLAKAHPRAAGKLLIVDSLPFYGLLFGPTATPDAIRPIIEQMRAGLVNGTSPLEVPPHMSNNDAGKAKVLAWLKTSDRKTVGEALVEDATTDIRADLPKLSRVPVTVLYAAPDEATRVRADAMYRDAYKALTDVKLIPIEGSEHFIMLDQPARFSKEVEAFLR